MLLLLFGSDQVKHAESIAIIKKLFWGHLPFQIWPQHHDQIWWQQFSTRLKKTAVTTPKTLLGWNTPHNMLIFLVCRTSCEPLYCLSYRLKFEKLHTITGQSSIGLKEWTTVPYCTLHLTQNAVHPNWDRSYRTVRYVRTFETGSIILRFFISDF